METFGATYAQRCHRHICYGAILYLIRASCNTKHLFNYIAPFFFLFFFICFRFAYSQTKYMWRKLSKTGVQVCSQQFLAHSFISRMFHFVYGAFFLSISGQNKYKLYNLYLKSFPSNNRQSMKVYICVCVCPCACVCVCVCL